MTSLARWCYRHRLLVVLLWIVGLVGIGATSAALGSKYSSDFTLPDTESTRALNLLTAAAPTQAGESVQVVAHATSGTLDDPASKAAIQGMLAQVAKVPEVVGAGDFFASAPGGGTINPARTIGFVDVRLDKPANELDVANVKTLISTAQKADSGALEIELGGNAIQFAQQGQGGGSPTEAIGVVAAAIILFLAFGSVFTMFLPILTALLALGTGISVIGFLSHGFSIAEFGPTLAALIGLGVGVDYALFIVSRHRVNLRQGHDPEESIVNAVNTSGRAVLFAGVTVCIAILGLLLLGVSFLYGLALSVVVVVLLTMLAALTFLPAMLGFVKLKALSRTQRRQVLAGDIAGGQEDLSPGWYRWATFVGRRPAPLATVAALLLIVLAIPAFSLRLGTPDAGGDPDSSTTRKAYDLLAEGFGPGFNGQIQVVGKVAGGSGAVASLADLKTAIAGTKGVASVTPFTLIPKSDVAVAIVYPASSPQDAATTDLITNLRANVVQPFARAHDQQLYVGGVTAIYQDFSDVLAKKLPLFVGVVVLLSFLLLTAAFRSLLVPLVASVMNLLSAGAAFGVVVAIFQWGWGAGLIGVDRTGPIIAFLPVMAFAILFGLSMDYEVFLVSRMYEEWHRTRDNDAAVALGQAETGRVITAAAAIMIAVFGSFVFGGDATIKLFGVALASAVLLDALIIRTILVPAIMHMLGKANWYLPPWLDRVLPRLNVESPHPLESEPDPVPVGTA